MYDYLVVGSGLYGATFAQQAKAHGKSVLVIDKRPNIAGNIYTEKVEGINFHKYGAHIFHTNNKEVWDYLQQFTVFNRFTNSPVANYKGELYSIRLNCSINRSKVFQRVILLLGMMCGLDSGRPLCRVCISGKEQLLPQGRL